MGDTCTVDGMRLFKPAVIILTLIVVALFLTGREGSRIGETTPVGSDRAGGGLSAPSDTYGETVRVYMDGWSMLALDGLPLYVDGVEVDLEPVDVEHLSVLMVEAPDLIGLTLARLVTADMELFCTGEGCSVRGTPVPFEQLADLSSVAVFGDIYRQLDLSHGLWFAEVPLPGDSDMLGALITAYVEGFGELLLIHQPFEDSENDSDVEPGEEEYLDELTPRTPSNGFGKGLFLISAGAGHLFSPSPQWVAGDGTGFERLELPFSPAPALEGSPVFGLSVREPSDLWLNWGVLTYATSPTTGCGGLMVCSVGAVSTQVENYEREDVMIQNEFGGEATLALISYDLLFDLDHEVHTALIWNGAQSPFQNADSMRTPVYDGHPPLHSGPGAIRISMALVLIDGSYGVPGSADEPLLANIAYRVAQHGFGDDTHRYKVSDLPNLFNGIYR